MSIEKWRKKIDEIDAALLQLLNQRAGYSREIGLIKRDLGLPVYDPQREREIFERLELLNHGPLGNPAVHRLFERILDESRRVVKSALLNDPGAAVSPAADGSHTPQPH